MTKASDNPFPSILITEGTEPSAPAAGKQRLYIDSTTHKLKRTDSSGVDVTIESAGSGAVATDTLFDAKGDLAVGTGADTAAKLTAGTNTYLLNADSAQSTGLAWIAPPVSSALNGSAGGDFTTSSATFVDITSASITVTTLARKIKVGFTAVVLLSAAGTASFTVDIGGNQGGTTGFARKQIITADANIADMISFVWMSPSALSAGSHTIKIQALVSAGTLSVKNASTSYWNMWVEECWS